MCLLDPAVPSTKSWRERIAAADHPWTRRRRRRARLRAADDTRSSRRKEFLSKHDQVSASAFFVVNLFLAVIFEDPHGAAPAKEPTSDPAAPRPHGRKIGGGEEEEEEEARLARKSHGSSSAERLDAGMGRYRGPTDRTGRGRCCRPRAHQPRPRHSAERHAHGIHQVEVSQRIWTLTWNPTLSRYHRTGYCLTGERRWSSTVDASSTRGGLARPGSRGRTGMRTEKFGPWKAGALQPSCGVNIRASTSR